MDYEDLKSLDTVLSLIKEQQEEIEGLKNINKNQSKDIKKAVDYIFELNKQLKQKDKQIDLMAEWISERCFYKDDYSNSCEIMQDSCSKEDDCKHCIKQYFERKAEDEK